MEKQKPNPVFEKLVSPFAKKAQECSNLIFSVDTSVEKDWEIVERLEGQHDHIFTLGNGNDEYQGILVVAAENQLLVELNKVFDLGNEMVDAIGETANTYCGMIMDIGLFSDTFGILTQSVPQYIEKRTFLPRVPAIHGKIYIGNSYLYFGYAIRSF